MSSSNISNEALNIFRKGLAQFITFDENEWTEFISYLNYKTVEKKDHFSVKDKVCDDIGFIINGSVRYYHIKDGTEITGYFSFENEFVSSYKSYLTQQPCTGYIQALDKTALIIISSKNMDLMLKNPLLAYKMERFGRLVAEYYICCYEDRITSFITKTPEERYLIMLQTEPEIMQRVPQHYIANFLGITPVSLSRIRKRTLVFA
ncbi:Crp/Fnr family transcriptional regulator [Pedobacter foliorum]|uniref:Crp/Fnr family transcriptional regulator n=1 Tax=Pedobacter foliorum TaxID=2739058 RepID=UPI0015631A83|nr:Crp/Fnr family transcriptional regulator [Pedobacter foliorum]NRF38301.1 Crp/Fnr family transcriptional regulator [Pedobacter foliorum]